MKKMILVAAFVLPGCVTTQVYQQQAQPSITEIQGQCMASYKKFLEQSSCIERLVSEWPSLNPYAQEYMASLQSFTSKVRGGKLSEDDARLQLAKELNRLKGIQDSSFAQQQALNNATAKQQYEMLKMDMPKVELYQPRQPVHTNCSVIGNRANCTSY